MLNKILLTWYSSYKVGVARDWLLKWIGVSKTTRVFFVFGCQRSGTTIVQKIIALNKNVKFYGEGDLPYFYQSGAVEKNRIKEEKDVSLYLGKEVFDWVVLKPLYESQRAEMLLSKYEGSKGVWVFRNYLDVINSHSQFYKYDVKEYLKPLFYVGAKSWLNEVLAKDFIEFLNKFPIDSLSDEDLYALFWIARNMLYFHVRNNPNILLLDYDELLIRPKTVIKRLCQFTGMPFYEFYTSYIRVGSGAKKLSFQLLPEIEKECERIYYNLMEVSR